MDIKTTLNIKVDKLVGDKDNKDYKYIISLKPLVACIKRTIYYLADFNKTTSQTIKAILEGLAT